MILIFGGTTEGRLAVKVADEAGKPYFYSTRGEAQAVECRHGVRLTGAMDQEAMAAFCSQEGIRLLVDAAHPFAEHLHTTIHAVAGKLSIPVVRVERRYPKRTEGAVWCTSYEEALAQLEASDVQSVLLLTGVQTLSKLKPFWQKHPETVWARVLDREESRNLAAKAGFSEKHLLYYKEKYLSEGAERKESNEAERKNSEEAERKESEPRRETLEGSEGQALRPLGYPSEVSEGKNLEGVSELEEINLFQSLPIEAIVTKESGESGGFVEKCNAAKALGLKVFIVQRPKLPMSAATVTGEFGLRKAIEHLLPGFFDLRSGYTTGSCATAAAKAALWKLLSGDDWTTCPIELPNGEIVTLSIESLSLEGDTAVATVVKDAGDDPDITHGKVIGARVRMKSGAKIKMKASAKEQLTEASENRPLTDHSEEIGHSSVEVRFLPGEGVGTVTLPGIGLPIGDPAINPVPRQMITRELQALCEGWFGTGADATIEDKSLNETHSAIGEEAKGKIGDGGIIEEEAKLVIEVEIFVPEGREIAKRTFNPKVGIVGGISILGTSGIVRPFSAEAFVEAIRREVEVSVAVGAERLVINSGAKSEAYVKRLYPNLPPQAFVHYGNFIGETLKVAAELHLPAITMGIMIGKAVKLAEGHLDTHSKHTVMNKPFLQRLAQQAGCSDKTQQVIETITLARELWTALPHEDARRFFPQLLQRCQEVASPLLPEGELTLLLIDEEGNVIKNEHP